MIISVIYNIVYFAVPSQVEDLSLEAGSHNIIVNWNKPINDSYCVTQYVIYWEHAQSGNNYTTTVESDKNSTVIEDLDACVEYMVSVSAKNYEDEETDAVTGKTRTETVGNYHAQIIVYIYNINNNNNNVCAKMQGNCDVISVRLDL